MEAVRVASPHLPPPLFGKEEGVSAVPPLTSPTSPFPFIAYDRFRFNLKNCIPTHLYLSMYTTTVSMLISLADLFFSLSRPALLHPTPPHPSHPLFFQRYQLTGSPSTKQGGRVAIKNATAKEVRLWLDRQDAEVEQSNPWSLITCASDIKASMHTGSPATHRSNCLLAREDAGPTFLR